MIEKQGQLKKYGFFILARASSSSSSSSSEHSSNHYHSYESENSQQKPNINKKPPPKPKIKCRKHEVYKSKGNACQRTCAGLNQPCCINFIVAPEGCYCEEDYARDTKCNRCIKIKSEKCKRDLKPACGPRCNETCGNPIGTNYKVKPCCRS